MRMMFSTMMECGKELQKFLEKPAETKGIVEMKDAVSRFTVDTIASCAFGLEANSFKNPDSEFRVQGRKIFKPSVWIIIQNMLAFTFPVVEKFVTVNVFSGRRWKRCENVSRLISTCSYEDSTKICPNFS